MKKSLVIIGAGGFAREVFSWLPDTYTVEAFYSNIGPISKPMFGIPVIRDLKFMAGCFFVVAVGDPKSKEILWYQAKEAGLYACDPIIHSTAVIGKECSILNGSIICPQTVVTTNVEIGYGVILNLGATVGHDSTICDFATVSPGANISGNVIVGNGSYIGTNACIREKITIAAETTIGMGAVVIKDTLHGSTCVGNPARQIKMM